MRAQGEALCGSALRPHQESPRPAGAFCAPGPSTQPGAGRGPRSLGTPAADPPHTGSSPDCEEGSPVPPAAGMQAAQAPPPLRVAAQNPPGSLTPTFPQGVTGLLGPQLHKEQEELCGWNDHGH